MVHTVVQVIPDPDFKAYVYFSDGKIKLFDMSPYLGKGVFKQVSDVDTFIEKCTVINDTLAWDIGGSFDRSEKIAIYGTATPIERKDRPGMRRPSGVIGSSQIR